MAFWLEPDPISGKSVPRAAAQKGGEALADALAEPAAAGRSGHDRWRVYLDRKRMVDPTEGGGLMRGVAPLRPSGDYEQELQLARELLTCSEEEFERLWAILMPPDEP